MGSCRIKWLIKVRAINSPEGDKSLRQPTRYTTQLSFSNAEHSARHGPRT